jgi:hypothetical protein
MSAGEARRSDNEFVAPTANLAELVAQILSIRTASELTDAHHAFLVGVDDLEPIQHVIALLVRDNKPVPEDLEEHSLRILLRLNPYDFDLTLALVALLYRTNRPIFPELPAASLTQKPQDASGLSELLQLSEEYARAGSNFNLHVYAALWQVCVRYPQTERGWAELARAFAERRDWSNCRITAEHVGRTW